MKEGRQYVPLDTRVAFGRTCTALNERWGLEGVGLWVLFLAACKRGSPQGQIEFVSDEEAWRTLGCRPAEKFTLDEFFKLTGQFKQTRRTRSGRVSYTTCTRWEDWNKSYKRQAEREQKARKRQESAPDILRTESGQRQRQRQRSDKGSSAREVEPVDNSTADQEEEGNGKVVHLYEVRKLLEVLSDADEGTAGVIASFARKLSEGAFHSVREQILQIEPHSPSGYAVAALTSMLNEDQFTRKAASAS